MINFKKFNAIAFFYFNAKVRNKNLKNPSFDSDFSIEEFIKKLNLEKNQIIFLHVGLQQIRFKTNLSYEEITERILKSLIKLYEPKAILVPTFCWSFIKSGLYSVNYSKSETGVFSEIFRKYSVFRTSHPIHNFSIVSDKLEDFSLIDDSDTNSENGIYNYLFKNNCKIVNISTREFRASPLHHVEFLNKLEYLNPTPSFNGVIYDKNDNSKKIKIFHAGSYAYKFSCAWNKQKIKNFLIKKNISESIYYKDLEMIITDNQTMYNALESELSRNPYFMITF